MGAIGRYLRMLLGVLILFEIIRTFLSGVELSIFTLILSGIFFILLIAFLIERDFSGIKSYIRFIVLILLSLSIIIEFQFDLLFWFSTVFLILSIGYFLKFS